MERELSRARSKLLSRNWLNAGGRRRLWTINGDFLSLQPNGVARYALEVTQALDELVAEEHSSTRDIAISIVAPHAPPIGLFKRIPVRIVPEFKSPRLPQAWVQVQLPFFVRGGLLSFCNLAPIIVRRQIICIHDLHTRIMPESYGLMFRLAHRIILPTLGRRARLITTVSMLSRDHLVEFGVAPAAKIVVAHNGSDHTRRWKPARSRLDIGARPFVLALGRKQAYKNSELVWRIAEPLNARGIDVYVAGDAADGGAGCFGKTTLPNVRLLGRIADDDLALALSRALCFVFPSRIEGFGLPAVEAMAVGCPVIASNAPCLPEVCGDAAIYAAPDDPDAWITAIDRLVGNDGARAQLIAKGKMQASKYSWRAIAEKYLELMACIDRES